MPTILGTYDPNTQALDALARSMFMSAANKKKKPGGPNPFGYPGEPGFAMGFGGGGGGSNPFAGPNYLSDQPPGPNRAPNYNARTFTNVNPI